MDLKTLLSMTTSKLVEEAAKIEGISGVHTMDKDQLIQQLAKSNEIELPVGTVMSEKGRALKPVMAKMKERRRSLRTEGKFTEARIARKQMKRLARKMKII